MAPIFFFSYAHGDEDRYLEKFFDDLCIEVATLTEFGPTDPSLSFRDSKNLSVMANWKTHIEGALQSSAVLVCLTSTKYLNSEFCGKEYYVFDQRRRKAAVPGGAALENILPVVWLPVEERLPEFMGDIQQKAKDMPATYLTEGLRDLLRFDEVAYQKCVRVFAKGIRAARKAGEKIAQLASVEDFEDIPNAFAGGDWQEAAEPGGWKRGPEVANFIFVAETKDRTPEPQFGDIPAEWRPYLPPEITTIVDYAQKAKKKQFLFREIRKDVAKELKAARDRLNLSLVIGSPKALVLESFKDVRGIEQVWWEGTALLVPCSEATMDDAALRALLKPAFPVLSSAQLPNFIGPIRTPAELLTVLDDTLSRMRNAVKGPEIERKPSVDPPPPSVSGSVETN